MAIFGLKPCPLGKMSIFRLLEFLLSIAQKGFFFCSRISQKTFSWPIFPKKKFGKMSIFGPKPWFIPFGKMSTLGFLNFLFLQPRKALFVLEYRKRHFIVQTRVFFVVKYRKRHFPCLYCLKKQVAIMVKDIFLAYIA